MEVRRFRANSMQSALAHVKRELGPEAVILNTKTFYQGGFFGLGKREVVEILASKEVKIVDTPPAFARQTEAYERYGASRPAPSIQRDARAGGRGESAELLRELSELKTQVGLLTREYIRDPELPPTLNEVYQRLLRAGVSKLLAKKAVGVVHTDLPRDQIDDREVVQTKLGEELGKLIRLGGGIRCDGKQTRKIVMTGPTGVGKTTTIAKLAAQYSIKERRKVGLITADTYRIAAVEQLKVYADIIGVTLDVVLTPKELREAIRRNSDKELLFIDTAGRSQRNQTRLVELKSFVDSAEPHENHLLISATTETEEAVNIIDKFSIVDVSDFIFSKVDECRRPGMLFDILACSEKPISYLTTGQDVPDDIEVATAPGLLNLLFRDGEQ